MEITMTSALEILVKKIELWFHESVAALPNIIVAAIIVAGFFVLSRFVHKLGRRFLERFSINRALNELMASSLQMAVVLVGIFIALGILNLEKTVTSLLTGAGIITFVIGFAFQDIAANFFSGILIAFKKPYQIGDVIEIEKNMGEVQEIELRSTMIRTFDGQDILIPNKNILTQVVTNYTYSPYRRVSIAVGVAYDSDLKKVVEVTTNALETLEGRDPSIPVSVHFTDFGASSVNLSAEVWIDYKRNRTFPEVKHQGIMAIHDAFKQNGIEIPFPITQLIPPPAPKV
ncbi:MAG: mechanosensitive ion channel [Bdellovibrionales bacterium]|nr:mechanosensitive ion channel [Bdellovibrionales bacterium]